MLSKTISSMVGWEELSRIALERSQERLAKHMQRSLNSDFFTSVEKLENGRKIIDLNTNDYLAIRHNRDVQTRMHDAIGNLPASAGASRLLGGEHPIFAEVEGEFARFKGVAAALYFGSGYAANESLGAMFGEFDCAVFSDELNHASIIDGLRMAKLGERLGVFRHGDLVHLKQLLERSRANINIIYTESLFSMDGDLNCVDDLLSLCGEHRGVLIIDEAHAIGCFGVHGSGLIDSEHPLRQHVISVNTCGKALGVQGAFVAGPNWLREWLINSARPFIFSTGPSPWLLAALKVSLKYIQAAQKERDHLQMLAQILRTRLIEEEFSVGKTESQIIPVLIGDESRTMAAQKYCRDQGVYLGAIRPPTVPRDSARLRLSLTCDLTLSDVDYVVATLIDARRKLGV